jgi:protein-disulfide isomerase
MQPPKSPKTPPIFHPGKNLFVDLAEKAALDLNVRSFWVCGRALMSEQWPWKGASLNAKELLLIWE